jgi:hypothetical protein
LETSQFINILHHFSGTSVEDAQAVLNLKTRYPFSQLLHTLSARASKDHGFVNSAFELQVAAIYAADRSVLKEIMALEFNPASDSLATLAKNHQQPRPTIPVEKVDFAQQVLTDLERLHHLKHNFEMMFVDGESEVASGTGSTADVEEIKESGKSKKERIRELAKAYIPTPTAEIEEENPRPRRGKKKDASDTLITALESKEELVPESEKHKEQLQVIDHFIRVQPTIISPAKGPNNNMDLSTIKTGEFGDNIISETLVEILLKQGKREKAVEVLKKLIWKFPQKKAYFAAQIEELRK